MPSKKQPPIQQTAIGDGNVQVAGNNNKVTIIQKFFNIFKSDAETVDQRNRRIMLGHVENFWVKGILEKSLHGAALLELGIKEDPDALNYPWAIKREANKETLPAGTSMLEIFQEIGMGRSLLILGTPGSGKTTMLLELTRQLIELAREDATEPIPVVFNLSSWTEKLTLADWLARELNNIYYVPKKTAPTWVKENKMLLLLDGLDEVRQESRDQCVDAINQFRKENGLTSIAVCSRIQEYAELKTRLSFDGAIEIQPLTAGQVNEYFERFGKGLAGIRQVLEKDMVLREMAETPLFLSIFTLAYRDKATDTIPIIKNLSINRQHLFDTYIERMFERPKRSKNEFYTPDQTKLWLARLARKMNDQGQHLFLLEDLRESWLASNEDVEFFTFVKKLAVGLVLAIVSLLYSSMWAANTYPFSTMSFWEVLLGLLGMPILGFTLGTWLGEKTDIKPVEFLQWSWKKAAAGTLAGVLVGFLWGLLYIFFAQSSQISDPDIGRFPLIGLNPPMPPKGTEIFMSVFLGGMFGIVFGLRRSELRVKISPNEGIRYSLKNAFAATLLFTLIGGTIYFLNSFFGSHDDIWHVLENISLAFLIGTGFGLFWGGLAVIQHYAIRYVLCLDRYLPWKLIPFLDYCVDLIFLRRVGGGYIFVHRLLMEHFAAMYQEEPK